MTPQTPKATLRLAERSDVAQLAKWMLDADYLLYWGRLEPKPINQQRDQVLELIALNQFVTAATQTFMIENSNNQQAIGFAQLADIQWKDRNCAIEIFIDPAHRQADYAVIGSTLVFDYAFNQLNMHKVYSYLFSNNTAVLELHQKIKHQPDAIFEKHLLINGAIHDVYVFSYFRNYYEKEAYPQDLRNIALGIFFQPEHYWRYIALLLSGLGYLEANLVHNPQIAKDKKFSEALKKFQLEQHLPASDHLDDRTLSALLEKVAHRINRA